ncbi:Serine protease, subtilisin family [Lentzea albidocapillata subsp. violacea]|uniref:Serine protease, subtilisin family n=1 Tax=Lentzea albidocapillata subsp. violacea TaxID=128104 RepID=A0A1G8VYA4_9PSEU|nr:S8 family peptidase [Lentzea albidocapillata]SDJ70753.1 Serine protease, subtilisin family [Lentzea albidocapillata subsp. violacea]
MGESWARRAAGIGLVAGTALVLSSVSATAAPEGEIRNLGASNAVKDNYIVVLKDVSTSSADNLSAKYGAKVKHSYKSALRGFSAQMSETQAKRLAADPAVAYVEQDGEVRVSDTQTPTPSWGLDRIDQRTLPLDNSYTYPNRGTGVTAYIIDTGIRISHTDFGGRAVHGRDTVDNDDDATDCNGHGTHVAGTVGGTKYGVAKDVKLVGVRVLNCSGSGTFAGVIAGIDWVTEQVTNTPANKPAVANMSLGGGANQTVDDAVKRSIAAGVTYGLAAGNDNGSNACNTSPARTPEAITVGSTDRTDARSSFSNLGSCLDIFAPGREITSSWHTNDEATNTISGTSMATPHVVGAAAVYLGSSPTATPQQVRDALVENATSDAVTTPGTGSPNKLLHITGTAPGNPPGQCPAVTNDTDTAIPDASEVKSAITVADCNGKASTTGSVKVAIKHTYRGDLEVSLIAPSGTVKVLKVSNGSDSADDLNATYAVNMSAEDANGTWQLRVRDLYRQDTGHIDSWTLDI